MIRDLVGSLLGLTDGRGVLLVLSMLLVQCYICKYVHLSKYIYNYIYMLLVSGRLVSFFYSSSFHLWIFLTLHS